MKVLFRNNSGTVLAIAKHEYDGERLVLDINEEVEFEFPNKELSYYQNFIALGVEIIILDSSEMEGEVVGGEGIPGKDGKDGVDGATFIPSIDEDGNLSWSNNKGLENPPTVNIKGSKGENGANGKDVDPKVVDEIKGRLNALEQEKFKVTGVPEGTIVEYRCDEIRVMCPKDAEFKQQEVGEGGSANMYYMALTTQAPEGAVACNEGDRGVISERNINLEGKKSKTIWLALASLSGSNWTYFGKSSTGANLIGWDYIIEWLDAEGKVIETNCIRINLTNEECHGLSLFSAVKEFSKMFKFNDAGELIVTINGVSKTFVPKA